MNILQHKLSQLLNSSARKGISKLKPGSLCANILENIDIDDILNNDIQKICENVSFSDMTKIISLATSMKIIPRDKRRKIKEELKIIAETIVKKTEQRYGKLSIPDPCRHLLLNL